MNGSELLAERERLVNKQETIVGRSQALIAMADAKGRALTATERETIESNTAAIGALQAQVDALDIELDRPQPRKTSMGVGDAPNARDVTRSSGEPGSIVVDAAVPGQGRYRNVFGATRGDNAGFKSLGDFVRAVGARDSQRLQAAGSGMREGSGADGGFLVPPNFSAALLDAAYDQEIIRPRARVIPLLTQALDAPIFSWTDRTKGPGALIGYWTGEGDQMTKQKAQTRLLTFIAKKLSILLPITNELLYDGTSGSDQYIQEAMAGTIAAYLDRAFFAGTGAGQPLGMINSASTITVSKEAGQAADTINFENVSKMIERLLPGSFPRSVWLAHPATLPQLMKLQIKIQNAAANDFVGGTVAPIQIAGDGSMTLMTRPVIVTDLCSALGDVGDLALCDFGGYAVAMQPNIRFAVSQDFGFDRDETYFRVTARCDGMSILDSAVTPRTGANTLGHCVVLEAR